MIFLILTVHFTQFSLYYISGVCAIEFPSGNQVKRGNEFKSKSALKKPEIPEPLPNITVAVGREATLPCVVKNLQDYKVSWLMQKVYI